MFFVDDVKLRGSSGRGELLSADSTVMRNTSLSFSQSPPVGCLHKLRSSVEGAGREESARVGTVIDLERCRRVTTDDCWCFWIVTKDDTKYNGGDHGVIVIVIVMRILDKYFAFFFCFFCYCGISRIGVATVFVANVQFKLNGKFNHSKRRAYVVLILRGDGG